MIYLLLVSVVERMTVYPMMERSYYTRCEWRKLLKMFSYKNNALNVLGMIEYFTHHCCMCINYFNFNDEFYCSMEISQTNYIKLRLLIKV